MRSSTRRGDRIVCVRSLFSLTHTITYQLTNTTTGTRTRQALDAVTIEEYDSGNAFALKTLELRDGVSIRLTFYDTARLDGLVERHDVFGKKMTEMFRGRDDRLSYRSVSLCGSSTKSSSSSNSNNNDEEKDSKRRDEEEEEEERENAVFTLPGDLNGGESVIRKMAEKFVQGKVSDDSVAKRIYYVRSLFF